MNTEHPILKFWFGALNSDGSALPEVQKRWWTKSNDFDTLCREEFGAELTALIAGERNSLLESTRGTLAYILLSDQISRNIYRDTPGAFASDALALEAALRLTGTGSGTLEELHVVEQSFVLMPFMHSESLAIHEQGLGHFEGLKQRGHDSISFAQRHYDIIARFGRYPHRNAFLSRTSTAEELEFLTQPGSSF